MESQVIIVGAGPAGIFCALTLANEGVERIVLLEQGQALKDRKRNDSEGMLCGWGGAGAYSDGKLTLSPEVGGDLHHYVDATSLHRLLEAADQIYVDHGAPDRLFGDLSAEIEELGNG